ncbi:hypothetical protein [Dactylosporangium sp. CA-139066]|uniref:hypothetical protein n=1 Tax=Dactylosporangium sp. CA-139066 TaxID=3239930 RepID=UPI003D8EB7AC
MSDQLWVRPTPGDPRWGHAEGLQIGLAPLPGPRGLIRIYAPYLGHPHGRMVNYVAVEPIPAGSAQRGFSELERSALDGEPGKRMWAANDPASAATDGVEGGADGARTLTVHVMCERFDSGAEVYVRARFDERRPHEVALAAFAAPGSVPLSRVVLTATMGNWARLRRLRLRDRTVTPGELWPGLEAGLTGDVRFGDGFAAHARFGLAELSRDANGAAVVTAEPDEPDPAAAEYAPGTNRHWHYEGRLAAQGWRVENPGPGLEAWVNGRHTYWASAAPIPGGAAYENVEVVRPFEQGQESVFTVEPLT